LTKQVRVRVDLVTLPEHVREMLLRHSSGTWGMGDTEFHVVPVGVANVARKLGGVGFMGAEFSHRP
jgi:hypothetical protein